MSEPAASSKDAVLAAAISAFARKGYAGTSVQDILGATGLSKPTLYYYFGSKAGLFRAILEFAFDESFRLVSEARTGTGSSRENLTEVAIALFQFASQHRDLIRLVIASSFAAPEELPPDTFDPSRRQRMFGIVEEIIRTGRKAGDLTGEFKINELAEGFLGAVMHPIRLSLLSEQIKLDRPRALRVVDLYLQGALA